MYSIDITAVGFSLQNAKECARAAAEAYDSPALIAEHVSVVESQIDGTQAVITDCGNCIVIAIQGTANLKQWITDAKAWRKTVNSIGLHSGFYLSASSVCPAVLKALSNEQLLKPIFICGHSLGGAIAQMVAWYIAPLAKNIDSIYTFGSPRVGDSRAVALYGDLADRTYRVTNGADIVPWLPGYLVGYRATRQEYFMSSLGGIINGAGLYVQLLPDLIETIREYKRGHIAQLEDHFIQTYRDSLDKL